MNHIDKLVYWIDERRKIHCLKTAGVAPPWTDDPILQQYRFCNVHREDDRTTKWIRQHWPVTRRPETSMVLARLFNNIDTLNGLGNMLWDFDSMRPQLKRWRDGGRRIFNPAYIVSTCGKSMDKIDYVLGVVEEVFYTDFSPEWHVEPDTCEWFSLRLMETDGIGTFLAGQVVADLKNTPNHPLNNAQDRFRWCSPGPGSLRGLGWLVGAKITPSTFQETIELAYKETIPRIGIMPKIDYQDFQNCLCEFDKYMRTKQGVGKPKQKYRSGQ